VWSDFTARTAAKLEEKALCEAVVKMISETFETLSVSVWLADENQLCFRCAGSTALSGNDVQIFPVICNKFKDVTKRLDQSSSIIDLEKQTDDDILELEQSHKDQFLEKRIRYLVPLSVGDDLLGYISLGELVKYRSFSLEEKDILRTIADQAGTSLLNLKLSERFRQAKEMEAFQKISAFFVHDLKNLASKLSMMLDNMPKHFDNPAFRDDALHMMSKSVGQINAMCSRLSLLREELDIQPVEIDVNQMIKDVISGFNGFSAGGLVESLQDLPKVSADQEQIWNVLSNLIINAGDAVGDDGEILVSTKRRDGWVEVSVQDNGCGMSKEFMDQCLFRPFQTTKTKGTGIGLFQSKMIVEAHNGRIEVESIEGEGSTFRVLLPVK